MLSAKTGSSFMRFWGKICGTKADYYIVESNLEGGGDAGEGEGEEYENTETIEPRGSGVN